MCIIFAPIDKSDNENRVIHFKDKIIEVVKQPKVLAVWFNAELKTNSHANKLSSELSKAVRCLYKIENKIGPWQRKKHK